LSAQGIFIEWQPPSWDLKAISGDGRWVVGDLYFGLDPRAMIWPLPGNTSPALDLGILPGAVRTEVFGVSFDGPYVVGETEFQIIDPGGYSSHVTLFRPGLPPLDLGQPSYSPSCWGEYVRDDGTVVIGSASLLTPFYPFAFRWIAPGPFQAFPENTSLAGMSADGSIVVGHDNTGCFRWNPITGPEPLLLSEVTTVSRDGSTGSVLATGSIARPGRSFPAPPTRCPFQERMIGQPEGLADYQRNKNTTSVTLSQYDQHRPRLLHEACFIHSSRSVGA
jgi:hypothetical protein